jgi:hypothetical protein
MAVVGSNGRQKTVIFPAMIIGQVTWRSILLLLVVRLSMRLIQVLSSMQVGTVNGYGNVVMIDHLNGYHTLYAHLSSINVSCGSNVLKGNMVARGGSTGNSTGPHLHFEVRYMGGFINPWTVLP